MAIEMLVSPEGIVSGIEENEAGEIVTRRLSFHSGGMAVTFVIPEEHAGNVAKMLTATKDELKAEAERAAAAARLVVPGNGSPPQAAQQ